MDSMRERMQACDSAAFIAIAELKNTVGYIIVISVMDDKLKFRVGQ